MERQDHLEFCKRCTNRKMDTSLGLICGLTNRIADFDPTCPSYQEDEVESRRIEMAAVGDAPDEQPTYQLSEQAIAKLKEEENWNAAIIAGVVAGLVGAILWAVITVATGYQIGYMAIGIGYLVGMAVRMAGKGLDHKFGFLAGGIALIACLAGNYLTSVGLTASNMDIGYLEAMEYYPLMEFPEMLINNFEIMDLLFYGFAAYMGFNTGTRQLTEEDLLEIEKNERPTSNF